MSDILIQPNEDGTWSKRKEPYATIECEKEEDFNAIMDAMEKREYVKPKEGITDLICPSCGTTVGGCDDGIYVNYCPECGQRVREVIED